ncbi:alpha/beta fold hydrolase [Streptomyces hoynatensis]|uniref:alpha/beta fold hydrolase n=1 Tax=Streptomyces hoynatensis TaxID=1141874 RepID=UPI001F4DDCE1|nr:alpha/beta hydrolase [Streptomyces hoynatensis]
MSWPRRLGIAGVALGAIATTVAVERLTVSRSVRRQARLALDTAGPYGTLRGTAGWARAEDGTQLYYETDEPAGPEGLAAAEAAALPPGGQGPAGGGEEPVTVVFSHGYCLSQDVWHFQRAALRGAARAVYWDQRSHGRSERGRAQREAKEPVTIDQLGRDLKAVLDVAAPRGPVVLVGHSMGGMTVMALAEQFPGYVAERVAGIAFLGASAGGLTEVTYGMPAPVHWAARKALPGVLRALGSQVELVERGRRALGDLYAGLIRRYSFGVPADVDAGVARFAERLIESVPIDVVADFYPAVSAHDKPGALAVLNRLAARLPVLVLTGDRDEMTPLAHSERIAAELESAELVVVPGAGHLLLLEAPGVVNEQLARLLARSIQSHE